MSNKVFANGREVSCKSAAGKAIASFPDVCMTPPQTPATPPGVPIPYPNTAMASDATDGSKEVKISGKEVMLKDQSCFKKSSGDEAGSAPMKGLVSHTNKGKAYFTSWSMDVKVEGQNVDRHMDMTTHNHNPPPGNTPPWLYADTMCPADDVKDTHPCAEDAKAVKEKCTDKNYKNDTGGGCCEAKKCVLAPYGSQPECCGDPKKTKHHVVPDHCFKGPGSQDYYKGIKDMSHGQGLCICVTGEDKNDKRKQHARIHNKFDDIEDKKKPDDATAGTWTFEEAKAAAAETCSEVTKCDEACLKHQMTEYYKDKNVNNDTVLRADSAGNADPPARGGMGTTMGAGSSARA